MSQLAGRLLGALRRAADQIGGTGDPDPGIRLAQYYGIDGFLLRTTTADADGEAAGRERYRTLETAVLTEAAREVSAVLTADGVEHFFFKGVALVGRVYQPGDRDIGDVDLFVRPSARREAVDRLRGAGYAPDEERRQSGPDALRAGITLSPATARTDLESVSLDLHWSLEPVDRLLSRPTLPLPESVWAGVERASDLPVPADEDHAALLIHHLVHHDLLHIRGLLDLALLCERLGDGGGPSIESVAGRLGVLRVTRLLLRVLEDELQLPRRSASDLPRGGWRDRRLLRLLHLPWWFAWAAQAPDAEHEMITVARLRRRALLVDRNRDVLSLIADAVAPPREYLAWRWPDARSTTGAWSRHARRLASKVAGTGRQ